jgi:hypothetical protein
MFIATLTAMRLKGKKPFVHYLAMYGCIATGLIYTAIGIIALLSAYQIRKAGADEGSLFVYLNGYFFGKLLAVIIAFGMISYMVWHLYIAFKDPYGYGTKPGAIFKRVVTGVSCLTDFAIANFAIQALLHKSKVPKMGQPTVQRHTIHQVMHHQGGSWLVLTLGLITLTAGIVQCGIAIKKSYMERLDIDGVKGWKRSAIHMVAWIGNIARGVVLGLIGFFLIKAATTGNLHYVFNTNRAFAFIGSDVGHLYFILVAIGTLCYGLFMFVFGVFYNSGNV